MIRTAIAAWAVLTVGSLPQSLAAAEPPEAAAFVAPDQPLIVTRAVVRTLHDGATIVARRSYRVTFAPEGDAFAVAGMLIASEISAPPALQALAELERRRIEPGPFPILIDRRGIAVVRAVPAAAATAQSGVDLARTLVESSGIAADEKHRAGAFIAAAAAQGSAIPWPNDLFSPAARDFDDRRELTLADGATGTVQVSHRIPSRLANGAPATFVREVVTEIGGTRRINREEWTLSARIGP